MQDFLPAAAAAIAAVHHHPPHRAERKWGELQQEIAEVERRVAEVRAAFEGWKARVAARSSAKSLR